MDRSVKLEHENSLIYAIDNYTELEFLDRKTIIVIDKDRFLVCKQLMLENAPDEDYAEFLNIPIEKVRYFKHKMQIFEDSIRARRRAARLNAQRRKKIKPIKRKREISSEERFKKARELISKNYSTNQISKILRISERSVTRFKKRIREEKKKLKAEGKIQTSPNDPDDENSFKYLSQNEKVKRAKELFQKRLKIQDISEILQISERSVRRWKDRITKMELDESLLEPIKSESVSKDEDVNKIDSDDNDTEDTKPKRKRRAYLDREKVQYATELIENGLSNKEMSMLLEMSIACVRKLKTKILNGTAEELIDDSEEHYKRVNKSQDDKEEGIDPLNVLPQIAMPTISQKTSCERKPKVPLSDRDMYIVRLLRDNEIRTMDIAKMIGISERSVTRLLSKSRDLATVEYDQDILEEVERLISSKEMILNEVVDEPIADVSEESKENIGLSLLAMNVKTKDIAKMLDVGEKIVHKWKSKMIKTEIKEEDAVKEYENNDLKVNEYVVEYLE
ncbi:chromosome partition protein Smc-like [Chironomus tepperi]|uniref:chromosome partition protein Smc-like n=1 Tax=Chironomus tepperi TaxID=113505 RepID=UPI00391F4C8C